MREAQNAIRSYIISIIWQYYLECHDVMVYVQCNQPINSMYSLFINISEIVYTSYILNAVNTLIMYVSVFIETKEKKKTDFFFPSEVCSTYSYTN